MFLIKQTNGQFNKDHVNMNNNVQDIPTVWVEQMSPEYQPQ